MGPKAIEKKRKVQDPEPESDDEIAPDFDGALSQSEDEFDSDFDDNEHEQDGEQESGSEASDDEDEEGSLLSDDIPSDAEGDKAMGKLVLEDEEEELKIEIPGVDPKRPEKDDGEKNYRIEKDANGNERYVYEYVVALKLDQRSFHASITNSRMRQ